MTSDRSSATRTTLVALVGAAVVALAAACGSEPVRPPRPQDAGVDRMSTAEVSGQAVYARLCLFCHGAEGRGDGLNATNLSKTPRNYTAWGDRLPAPAELRSVIEQGGAAHGLSADMPSFGRTLPAEQLDDVVAYVLLLASGAPQADAGSEMTGSEAR